MAILDKTSLESSFLLTLETRFLTPDFPSQLWWCGHTSTNALDAHMLCMAFSLFFGFIKEVFKTKPKISHKIWIWKNLFPYNKVRTEALFQIHDIMFLSFSTYDFSSSVKECYASIGFD